MTRNVQKMTDETEDIEEITTEFMERTQTYLDSRREKHEVLQQQIHSEEISITI